MRRTWASTELSRSLGPRPTAGETRAALPDSLRVALAARAMSDSVLSEKKKH